MCLAYFEEKVNLDFSSLSQKAHLAFDSLCLHKPSFLRNCFLASLLASHALTFTSVIIKVDPGLAYYLAVESPMHTRPTWEAPRNKRNITSLFIFLNYFISGFSIDTFVEKTGRMTLHFFKGHCYWQLIYLSGEMRLDIKTFTNSWVFNKEAVSRGSYRDYSDDS